jgi:hypothetical protein
MTCPKSSWPAQRRMHPVSSRGAVQHFTSSAVSFYKVRTQEGVMREQTSEEKGNSLM